MIKHNEETSEKLDNNSLIDEKEIEEKDENPNFNQNFKMTDKENNQIINNCKKDSSFFITESNTELKQSEVQKRRSIKPPLPNLCEVLNDSKARETILYSNFKNTENSSFKKAKPLMIMDGFDHNLLYHKEGTPPNNFKDFSRLSNCTDGENKTRVTRDMGLSEIHTAAQSLKGEMVLQNRCKICTLKLPCKHFSSIDEMRESEPITQNVSAICNFESCVSTVPNFSMINQLPRINSQGIQRRCDQGKLTPLQANSHSIERIIATEKDSSFASGFAANHQLVFKDNHSQQASHTFVNSMKRLDPSDRTTCTIRIRSKNNVEIVKGNVKRTISEIRK